MWTARVDGTEAGAARAGRQGLREPGAGGQGRVLGMKAVWALRGGGSGARLRALCGSRPVPQTQRGPGREVIWKGLQAPEHGAACTRRVWASAGGVMPSPLQGRPRPSLCLPIRQGGVHGSRPHGLPEEKGECVCLGCVFPGRTLPRVSQRWGAPLCPCVLDSSRDGAE